MLQNVKNRKEDGFTIIEVLIVLAIAGLIIAIVLLAVPALQRNGRNTAIKNDANAIAAAVSEYASNNDGAAPNAATGGSSCSTGSVSLVKSGGTASVPKIQGSTDAKCTLSGAQGTVTPAVSEVDVVFGAKCGTASGANYSTTANTRSTAIIYALESTGNNIAKCIDS